MCFFFTLIFIEFAGYIHADGVLTMTTHMANIAAVHIALSVKVPSYVIKGFVGMATGQSNATMRIGSPSILISEGNHDSLKIFGIFGGTSIIQMSRRTKIPKKYELKEYPKTFSSK